MCTYCARYVEFDKGDHFRRVRHKAGLFITCQNNRGYSFNLIPRMHNLFINRFVLRYCLRMSTILMIAVWIVSDLYSRNWRIKWKLLQVHRAYIPGLLLIAGCWYEQTFIPRNFPCACHNTMHPICVNVPVEKTHTMHHLYHQSFDSFFCCWQM